jgi:tetratricopeptide (TPR) repeat protein
MKKKYLFLVLILAIFCNSLSQTEKTFAAQSVNRITSSKKDIVNNAEFFFKKGFIEAKAGDHLSAIKDYDKAINLKSDYAKAFFYRGLSKQILGNNIEAVSDFTRVISLNPNYEDIYEYRAYSKSELKDYVGAVEDTTKAISINNKDAKSYYVRGSAKYSLKDREGALDDYEKAKSLFLEQQNYDNYKTVVGVINATKNTGGVMADYNQKDNLDSYMMQTELSGIRSELYNLNNTLRMQNYRNMIHY